MWLLPQAGHPSGGAFLHIPQGGGVVRPHGAQDLKAPKENIFLVMCLETISHMPKPPSLQGRKPKNVLDTLEAKETFPASRSCVKSLQMLLRLVVQRFSFFILFFFLFLPSSEPFPGKLSLFLNHDSVVLKVQL